MYQKTTMLLVIVLYLLKVTKGLSLQDTKNIYKNIFNGYNREIFPLYDKSNGLHVGITFWLKSINRFDEVNEILMITAMVSMNWIDPSLSWDPETFGNTSVLRIPSSSIWIPWLYLLNSADELYPLGRDTHYLATVNADGVITCGPGAILKANCPTDVSKFPFDTQICTLKFVTWGAGPEVVLSSTTGIGSILLDYYTPNPHWNIKSHRTFVEERDPMQMYKVEITLQRKPVYYFVVIVLPTLMFSLLNPLVFLLPIESGERISLSMTILLAFVFFLTLVANFIPESSTAMCFLLVIMIIMIAISSMIVVFVIITTRLYYQVTLTDKASVDIAIITYLYKQMTECTNEPMESKELSGADLAKNLDKIFMFVSYSVVSFIMTAYCYHIVK
jgi:hypothetical protein